MTRTKSPKSERPGITSNPSHFCELLQTTFSVVPFKHRICTERKLVSTTDKNLATMITKDPSVLNYADIDQIHIFRFWYSAYQAKVGPVSPEGLINDFTVEE